MKPRLATSLARSCAVLAVVSVVVGCGSLKRVGKDLAVVATSPVTVPLSAGYDSLEWGENSSTATSFVLAPANMVLYTIKHAAYTTVYLGDLLIAPVYLLASITPQNDLEPIQLYSLNRGYPWKSEPWPVLEE